MGTIVNAVIYTDDECLGGFDYWRLDGDAAAVVTTGTAVNPVVMETLMKEGGNTHARIERQFCSEGSIKMDACKPEIQHSDLVGQPVPYYTHWEYVPRDLWHSKQRSLQRFCE